MINEYININGLGKGELSKENRSMSISTSINGRIHGSIHGSIRDPYSYDYNDYNNNIIVERRNSEEIKSDINDPSDSPRSLGLSNMSNTVQIGSTFMDLDSFDSVETETETENKKDGPNYSNAHVFIDPKNYYPIAKSLNAIKQSYLSGTIRKVPKRNKQMVFCTLSISFALTVLWFYRLINFTLDNLIYNFLWIPLTLISIFILLFPIHIVVSGCANIFGSTEFFFTNSKYYSCVREYNGVDDLKSNTDDQNDRNSKYTNVTIQIPVYKEDFDTVIKPTLKSAMLCRKYYETMLEHDIVVNIFVNDDGLQVLEPEDVQKRIEFYDRHNIGYVARPPKNRAGKFKKASNMNFGIEASRIYMELLKNYTEEESKHLTKFYYENKGIHILMGNNITIGDYVLLLDSDTRIPINCLHDVLREFRLYPELGYTQHLTYPMLVTNTYWEKFIGHFTTLIYDLAIPISVAGGDVSPLVGHCAILRTSGLWKLLVDKNGKERKIWSEENVSEDFRLFMDLTSLGYYGRYITYTNKLETKHFHKHNFLEGISMEFVDELAKFKKYGYGTCEMLFNPVNKWFKKGIIGSPIIEYCKSNVEFTSKVGIISYLFTYIAIAIGLPMSYINYFVFGWFNKYIDTLVLPVHIAIQVSLLFSGLGTLANSIFKARVLRKDTINVIWYNLVQTPFYLLFFGTLPYHLVHMMFKYFADHQNISWGSTRKEVMYSSRFDAIKSTIIEFKWMYIFFTLTLIMIPILYYPIVPENWRITEYNAIVPLATTSVLHMIGPILLNPYIMTNNKLKRMVEDDNEHDLNFFINN